VAISKDTWKDCIERHIRHTDVVVLADCIIVDHIPVDTDCSLVDGACLISH